MIWGASGSRSSMSLLGAEMINAERKCGGVLLISNPVI
jgi:hypothetical protein